MNADSFLKAVAELDADQEPPESLLNAVSIVAEHYGRSGPVKSVASVVARIKSANHDIAEAVLSGMAKGWPAEKKPTLDAGFEADLKELMAKLPVSSRGQLLKLAISWGSKEFESYAKDVSKSLLAQLDDQKLADEKRLLAARELVAFRSKDAAAPGEILKRITPQTEPALATGLIESLRASEATSLGKSVVDRFGGLSPKVRAAGIAVLLSRPASTKALLKGVDEGKVLLSELSLDQKQALAAHPDRGIREQARTLLSRGGALPNPDRQKVLAELLPLTKQTGDAKAGKEVFKKQCSKCHIHSGEGTRIGPDLTGMAVHPKEELLTHIIDPSRDVEGNFRVYTVLTTDGLVISGLLASESKTAIELFDVEGKKKVVLREEIEDLKASRKSLMPEGFEKQVKHKEISDLLEFLTQRGRFLPLDLRKAATIASDRGMFFNRDAEVERLVFRDWSPKTFEGVPFHLTDPNDGKVPNVILLHGPIGGVSKTMPKSVSLKSSGPARAIHLLSGVSGWGFPYARDETVSVIVRLYYADGETEDHQLKNGVHFADYIRRVDVRNPSSPSASAGSRSAISAFCPSEKRASRKSTSSKAPTRPPPW